MLKAIFISIYLFLSFSSSAQWSDSVQNYYDNCVENCWASSFIFVPGDMSSIQFIDNIDAYNEHMSTLRKMQYRDTSSVESAGAFEVKLDKTEYLALVHSIRQLNKFFPRIKKEGNYVWVFTYKLEKVSRRKAKKIYRVIMDEMQANE